MHIDSSFVPLAPGKVLVNPEYIDPDRLPPMFKSWDVCIAPPPDPIKTWRFRVSMCSPWISVNVLALDEKRIIVEQTQRSLIKALAGWGFEPIPCSFAIMPLLEARFTAPPSISGAVGRWRPISSRWTGPWRGDNDALSRRMPPRLAPWESNVRGGPLWRDIDSVASLYDPRPPDPITSPELTLAVMATHKISPWRRHVVSLQRRRMAGMSLTASHKGEPVCLDLSLSYEAPSAFLTPKLYTPSW